MSKFGLLKITEAKISGAWHSLNQSDKLKVPSDLTRALKKNSKANAFFKGITKGSKKIILEWIYNAKTDETRRKRVQETVRLANQGKRANHYRDLKNNK